MFGYFESAMDRRFTTSIPKQGDYYFHKFQNSITIYSVGGIRQGSVAIPKEMNGETLAEVFINCSKNTK